MPLVVETAVEETAKTFLPLIGTVITAPMSFGGTYWALKVILEKFEEVALDVIKSTALVIIADETGDEEETWHS